MKLKKATVNKLITYLMVIGMFTAIYILNEGGYLSRQLQKMLVPICINIILAISLNITVGFLGELTLGHAAFMSVGAYSGCLFSIAMKETLPMAARFPLAMLVGGLVAAVFGILVAYLIFIPLRKQKSMIFTIMATIMFGKVIMEGACLIWGGNAFTIPDFMSGTYQIGNAVISKSNLFLIIAAIVIVALLQFYLQKTKPGKAMRCVAQNRTAASIVGIDVNRNMAITIAISTVICCCIGILVVPLYNVSSTMSNMIGLKGFAAGVLGGFGYMPGCIAGGLVLGIVENIASMILPSVYKDVVAFVLLVAFLLFRPQGLLGKKNK